MIQLFSLSRTAKMMHPVESSLFLENNPSYFLKFFDFYSKSFLEKDNNSVKVSYKWTRSRWFLLIYAILKIDFLTSWFFDSRFSSLFINSKLLIFLSSIIFINSSFRTTAYSNSDSIYLSSSSKIIEFINVFEKGLS